MTTTTDKTLYTSFDDYAVDYAEGEQYRNWLADRQIGIPDGDTFKLADSPLLIFKGDGPHGGIPGGFLWSSIGISMFDWERGYVHGNWFFVVHVHDCDDGLITRKCGTIWEFAVREQSDLAIMAPISMDELVEHFRYEWSV